MGNVYWSGALPGLVLGTVASVGLLRLLGRPALKHVVWLVPALHFAGAFGAGPALAVLFHLVSKTLPSGTAGPLWAAVFLAAAAIAGLAAVRRASSGRSASAALASVLMVTAGILVPLCYHIIAG